MSPRGRSGLRLVHLSDLHLGLRVFAGSERGWNRREADLARALRRAVREIVRLAPDLVLITGDLFDQPDPPSTAFLTLHRGLQTIRTRLPSATVLAIAGERDSPLNAAAPGPLAVLDMLPGVQAAAGAPRVVRIRKLGVHALLVPHRATRIPPPPELRADPDARWNLLLIRGAFSGGAGDPAVGTAIGAVSGGSDGVSAIPVDPSEWDYVAVGGPHRGGEWAPNVRCPGSLERPGRDPWRFATEERGFLFVDLGRGETEFHPIPSRAVVDLAPIRLTPGDPAAGTRRFRELIDGIPAGVDGKIVRARFEGDVASPEEGVSAALLSAVRGRTAHLEVWLGGDRAARGVSPSAGGGTEATGAGVGEPIPGTLRIRAPDGSLAEEVRLGGGLVLLTAESDETRVRIVGELGGGSRGRRRAADPGSVPPWTLSFDSTPPSDGVRGVAWAGRDDWRELLLEGLRAAPAVSGLPPDPPGPGREDDPADDLETRAVALRDLRADSIEAFGDMEARSLEWARERQDAESHLAAYRSRAQELRRRLRSFESEGEASACPTCGRPMEEEYARVVSALREEWETLVQDGRWWARRRGQLEEKPEDLRHMEERALTLNALVEETGEEIERLRERARLSRRPTKGVDSSGEALADEGAVFGSAAGRRILREAGSFLGRLTDGRTLGIRVGAPGLVVVDSDGSPRSPEHGEGAAILGALHTAIWSMERGRSAGGHAMLLWEFLETGAADLACAAIELLAGLDLTEDRVIAVVPPVVLERLPEAYGLALEIGQDERGRWTVRRFPGGIPPLDLARRRKGGRRSR